MNNLIDIIVKYNNLTKEEKELFNKVIKTSSIEEKQSSILKQLNDYVEKNKDKIPGIQNPYVKKQGTVTPWIHDPYPYRQLFGDDLFYQTSDLGK